MCDVEQSVMWKTNLRDRIFVLASTVLRLIPTVERLGRSEAHISAQLFSAVTSIGANFEESQVAASRRDMALKQAVALREAKETHYWLRLLSESSRLPPDIALTPLLDESSEIVAMLTTSVKKLRDRP
jgi:four helix bundle protein